MASVRRVACAVAVSVLLAACGNDDEPAADTVAANVTDVAESTTAEAETTTTLPETTTTSSTTTTSTTTTTPTTTSTTSTTTTTVPAPESARYRVTIVLEWSPETHPVTLPPGWHTSPPVLAVHDSAGAMIPLGAIASPGVELMAETGQTPLLVEELQANAGVGEVVTGQRVDGAGSDVLEIGAPQATPLLSVVTMLAPSPDWFVGVIDVPLFDGGVWAERIELDVIPWDAGTDSGPEYTSDDADTQPRQPIDGPRDPLYITSAAEGRYGHVVIERIG